MNLSTQKPPELSAAPRSEYKIRVYSTVREFDELARDWQTLDDVADSPTEQFIWSQAAATAFLDDDPLRVITVWRDGKLRAAAPLALRRQAICQHARLLGVGDLWEPMDIAAADPGAREALVRYLIDSFNYPLHFERLPADSPTLDLVARAARGMASHLQSPQADCPFIPLDPSWREPESHLNAGRRSDLRRARRKAEKLGAVETLILAPRPSELGPLLDEAFAVEASGWKGAAESALHCDPRRASFFRRYAAAAARAGILRILCLRIAGELAAMQIAVETRSKLWLLKIGYEQRLSGCSPGMLLMRDSIAYAADAGLAGFEFLGSAESWTAVWTEHVRKHVSLRVYPWRLGGLMAMTTDAAMCGIGRWRNKRATS